MIQNPHLLVRDIKKSYKQKKKTIEALAGISLVVKKHEIVSIIGPSGCGKSTFFHILSGTETKDSGEILLEKKKVNDGSGKFGYMFQEPLLFPWRSVIENVMIGFIMKGVGQNKAEEMSLGLLSKFKLDEFAHMHPDSLSGGMKQKVALLRTIAFNSSFLLLDEPFGSLDAITRTQLHYYLFDVVKSLCCTVLFTTHDIREALFLSDRIYVMSGRPGKIIGEVTVPFKRPHDARFFSKKTFLELEIKLSRLLEIALKSKDTL